jgi:hypothetical protein
MDMLLSVSGGTPYCDSRMPWPSKPKWAPMLSARARRPSRTSVSTVSSSSIMFLANDTIVSLRVDTTIVS